MIIRHGQLVADRIAVNVSSVISFCLCSCSKGLYVFFLVFLLPPNIDIQVSFWAENSRDTYTAVLFFSSSLCMMFEMSSVHGVPTRNYADM